MGCFWSRNEDDSATNENTATFKRSTTVDLSDYMYQELIGVQVGKVPGQLNGEDFIIEDCKNSSIYLLDNNAAVTIDDCSNCQFFIGPCKGSVFIRNCVGCVLMVACQQFRTRDCHQCVIYLHCSSQPVIEASSEMRFGCFQCHYTELKDQFKSAGLSVFNNNWYSIHNFTPEVEDSWSIIRKNDDCSKMDFSPNPDSDLSKIQVTFSHNSSDVPLTIGKDNVPNEVPSDVETCLVVFSALCDNDKILEFTRQFTKEKGHIVMTKETDTKLFDFFSDNSTMSSSIPQGQSVFIETFGEQCISVCTALLSCLPPDNVYWSRDGQQGNNDVHRFHQSLEQNFKM